MQYAVFMRIKYATTPRNFWTHYPSRSSNGWAEFLPEPMKFLIDMLNHTHWLRIVYNKCLAQTETDTQMILLTIMPGLVMQTRIHYIHERVLFTNL